MAVELSDPVGSLEVGTIGRWSSSARGAGPRGVDAFTQDTLDALQVHEGER